MDRLKKIESRYNASLEVSEEDFEWLIKQVKQKEQLEKDKLHFMEMYSKECKSNEQNLMAYLGEKEKYKRLRDKILEQTIQNNYESLKKLADS